VQAEVQADAWCLCRLTHGFIRTAHAVRSCALTAGPSAHQIDELAHGLAYWAARYGFTHGITVIVDPTDLRWGDSTLTEAIARIPRPPGGINGRIPPPLAVQRFGEILPSAELRAATGMIAKPDDVDTALSQLTAQFSGVFLARDEGIPGTIAHVVTVPAALRLVLPHPASRTAPAELCHAVATGRVAHRGLHHQQYRRRPRPGLRRRAAPSRPAIAQGSGCP
jgi:hypothetical protein